MPEKKTTREELTLDEAIELLKTQREKGKEYIRKIAVEYDESGEMITALDVMETI